MSADPEPDDSVRCIDSERSIRATNSNRPETAHSLEMKRWMVGIDLEQIVVFARELLNVGWKPLQARPELGRSEVLHMPLVSPRSCAANASAASRSSFP